MMTTVIMIPTMMMINDHDDDSDYDMMIMMMIMIMMKMIIWLQPWTFPLWWISDCKLELFAESGQQGHPLLECILPA